MFVLVIFGENRIYIPSLQWPSLAGLKTTLSDFSSFGVLPARTDPLSPGSKLRAHTYNHPTTEAKKRSEEELKRKNFCQQMF